MSENDTTKSEAWENLVALGATLAAVEPVTGAAMMLAGKVPGWWTRRAGARATAWWKAFLDQCRTNDKIDLGELRARIEEQMEENPETADVIMGHMRDVLDTVTSEAVAILGSLRGAYYRGGMKPDAFFRGATELLMQCTEADLEALRVLTGRIACIVPAAKSRTLAIKDFKRSTSGVRTHEVEHVELDEAPNAIWTGILGVAWPVDALWQRTQHLLTACGMAQRSGQFNGIIVEYDEMHRLHHLIKRRGLSQGTYHFRHLGMSNSRSAELVEIPSCFGYGETPEAAFELMKRNMHRFVEDAATAELVEETLPT